MPSAALMLPREPTRAVIASGRRSRLPLSCAVAGGTTERTGTSLQNRFNKVLQAEINKYIAIQHRVLREYKSGWHMADYDTESKRKFMVLFGKTFKHEGQVLAILKETPIKVWHRYVGD